MRTPKGMPSWSNAPMAGKGASAQDAQVSRAVARQNGPNSIWRYLTRASAVIDVLAGWPCFVALGLLAPRQIDFCNDVGLAHH